MSEDRKREIIRKIKSLQIEQDELITQLENLNINSNNEQHQNTNNSNELQIGDPVIILNPGRFQERSGKIHKIGKQITIITKKGRKIVRAKKNIQKLE
jgi:NCAIR mutase (PurE)-related protein